MLYKCICIRVTRFLYYGNFLILWYEGLVNHHMCGVGICDSINILANECLERFYALIMRHACV